MCVWMFVLEAIFAVEIYVLDLSDEYYLITLYKMINDTYNLIEKIQMLKEYMVLFSVRFSLLNYNINKVFLGYNFTIFIFTKILLHEFL